MYRCPNWYCIVSGQGILPGDERGNHAANGGRSLHGAAAVEDLGTAGAGPARAVRGYIGHGDGKAVLRFCNIRIVFVFDVLFLYRINWELYRLDSPTVDMWCDGELRRLDSPTVDHMNTCDGSVHWS